MAHWYDTDGRLHEYFWENGKRKAVTLRQARWMGLVPSVTTILRETVPNAGLMQYWEAQAIEAAATTPRHPEMGDAEWKKRVRAAAAEHRDAAAAEGTRLHDQLSEMLPGGPDTQPPPPAQLHLPLQWLWSHCQLDDSEKVLSEKAMVDPAGAYAGTIDLLAPAAPADVDKMLLIDFKTQVGRLRVYPEFGFQLAAYRSIIEEDSPITCVSLVFSRAEQEEVPRTDPKRLLVKVWTEDEMARNQRIWERCLWQWQDLKCYWPGRKVDPLIEQQQQDALRESVALAKKEEENDRKCE